MLSAPASIPATTAAAFTQALGDGTLNRSCSSSCSPAAFGQPHHRDQTRRRRSGSGHRKPHHLMRCLHLSDAPRTGRIRPSTSPILPPHRGIRASRPAATATPTGGSGLRERDHLHAEGFQGIHHAGQRRRPRGRRHPRRAFGKVIEAFVTVSMDLIGKLGGTPNFSSWHRRVHIGTLSPSPSAFSSWRQPSTSSSSPRRTTSPSAARPASSRDAGGTLRGGHPAHRDPRRPAQPLTKDTALTSHAGDGAGASGSRPPDRRLRVGARRALGRPADA